MSETNKALFGRKKIDLDQLAQNELDNAFMEYQVFIAAKSKIEAIVISTMLNNSNTAEYVMRNIREDDFTNPDNVKAYNVIKSMYKKGLNIDPEFFVIEANNHGLELTCPVVTYILNTPTSDRMLNASKLGKLCLILKEHSMEQKAKMLFMKTFAMSSQKSDNQDFFIWMDGLRKDLDEIMNIKGSTITDTRERAMEVVEIEKNNKALGKISNVTTGYKTLDYNTGGFQNSDLILVAGRPGMGKTALLVSIINKYMFTCDTPFGLFSLEMSFAQLIKRLFAQRNKINLNKITAGKMNNDNIAEFEDFAANLPAHGYIIDDIYDITNVEITSEILVHKHGVKAILIDYLQLIIGGQGENKTNQVGDISRRLKMLAKKLDVPVIALSQLSRVTKQSGNQKGKPKLEDFIPDLEDLRDSGSLEQDADMVMFLFRPDYYKEKVSDYSEEMSRIISVIVKKFRSGSPFRQNLGWDETYAEFLENENKLKEIETKEQDNEFTRTTEPRSESPF
jgi:replicative DNA helicase